MEDRPGGDGEVCLYDQSGGSHCSRHEEAGSESWPGERGRGGPQREGGGQTHGQTQPCPCPRHQGSEGAAPGVHPGGVLTPLQGQAQAPVGVHVEEEHGEVEKVDGQEHEEGEGEEAGPGVA